jgi:hypothetical protein
MPTKLSLTLEASQYKQDLDDVVQRTRQAATDMSANLSPKSTKSPESSGSAEKAAEKAAKAAEREAEKAAKAAEREAVGIKSVWKEMTKLEGGTKRMVATMLAGGGLIGIVMAGVQSVIKLCTMALDAMAAKGKEAAETHRQYADSIAEAAANNDRLKQSSNEAITQLSAMASAAKLSNAEQEKAVSLIAALTRQYGDLGVSVDKATGKIKGLGTAIVEKETRDTQRQIRSIEAQLKERRSARNQEDRNVSGAGYNVGKINKAVNWLNPIGIIKNLTGMTDRENAALGLDKTQIYGEQDAKEAAERRAKDDQEILKLEMQRQEAKKKLAELAKKQLEQTRIQNAALKEEKKERDKQARYRAADNELGRLTDTDAKIANRQALIDAEKKDNAALRARTAAAKADMDRYKPGAKEADAQKYADAQRVYLQNAAEQAKSDEKIANWQNQIKQLEYERAEAKRKMLEQSKFELEYNRLIAAGEYDKAAALKLEHELKQRNLKLTEAEKKAILDQQKAQKALALQKSNRDKAQDLKWRAMEKAGRGKEASEQRALWDAERTKGRKLTPGEIAATKKLHELTWQLDNRRGPDFGDLSIKTNDLTRRGGFQGGAVVPDKDKYNQQIASENKAMHAILQRIESMVAEFGKF